MRKLIFDQYEFDPPESEQALEMAISSPRQHRDIAMFLAACGASGRAGSPPTVGWPRWGRVAETIRLLAGIELPPANACRVVVLSDDWDDLELAVASDHLLVWYHWWTTA